MVLRIRGGSPRGHILTTVSRADLPNDVLLVDGDVRQHLHDATGPGDADAVDDGGVAKAEMQAQVALRQVAAAGSDLGAGLL